MKGVQKSAPGKILPGKKNPGKLPPGKLSPGNILPGKLPPGKLFYLFFVDIILQLFIFELFIETSFRGVSRAPATSIMNLLVTLVNGII